MNNKVIYTANFGDYDTLKTPEYINDDWDYVCFTDAPQLQSNVWKIKYIPTDTPKLTARRIKIRFFDYVSEYDMSLWIDASVAIKNDVTDYVKKHTHLFGNADLVALKHPVRNSIIDEAEACTERLKAPKYDIQKQMKAYFDDGYMFDNGLISSGLIFRNHTEQIKEFCRLWFAEIEKHTKRDQLSFNYVLYKYPVPVSLLPYDLIDDGKYFKLMPHLP